MLHKLIIKKNNKNKNQYEKYQQSTKSFDKVYRKYLQDNANGKIENESLCTVFTNYLDETKIEFS